MAWAIKFKKDKFIGRESLLNLKDAPLEKKLVGFFVTGKGIVREEMKIIDESGQAAGWVTSGTITPTIGKALGLAYVDNSILSSGKKLLAEVRNRQVEIEITDIPFYNKSEVAFRAK